MLYLIQDLWLFFVIIRYQRYFKFILFYHFINNNFSFEKKWFSNFQYYCFLSLIFFKYWSVFTHLILTFICSNFPFFILSLSLLPGLVSSYDHKGLILNYLILEFILTVVLLLQSFIFSFSLYFLISLLLKLFFSSFLLFHLLNRFYYFFIFKLILCQTFVLDQWF